MRLIMLGTGDFALPTFRALCASGHEVLALVTQPDRPQGRKQEIIPSPIKLAATGLGIPVHHPEDVNGAEARDRLDSLAPDLLVTAAYGQILSAEVLGIPRLGGINLHGSILPSYRGAAPVARAIQDGRTETGVTVIRMTPRIDAGGMIAFARAPIGPDQTAGEVEAHLAAIGAPLILLAIADIEAGTASILPQDKTLVTKAPKLRKEDGVIDWSRPAQVVHNLVRAMNPWPLASTTLRPTVEGKPPDRLIVHRTAVADPEEVAGLEGAPGTVLRAGKNDLLVAAGQGAVAMRKLQVPGRTAMEIGEFLRGFRVQIGDVLGDP